MLFFADRYKFLALSLSLIFLGSSLSSLLSHLSPYLFLFLSLSISLSSLFSLLSLQKGQNPKEPFTPTQVSFLSPLSFSLSLSLSHYLSLLLSLSLSLTFQILNIWVLVLFNLSFASIFFLLFSPMYMLKALILNMNM